MSNHQGNKKIFIVNAGSSSVKYRLFEFNEKGEPKEIADGNVEKIGEGNSKLSHHNMTNDKKVEEESDIKDHHAAIDKIVEILTSKKEHGVISDVDDIYAVGHRLVHGGDHKEFIHPTKIDDKTMKMIKEVEPLAPLHIPANIEGIKKTLDVFKKPPQYVVCDTAFHHTLPPVAFRYAVPNEWYEEHKIRRYGFHGISHLYVAKKAAKFLKKDLSDLNLITVHLGNGCSVTCIKKGESVDTSMGFTPLEGVVMGTRSGDMSAGALEYYGKKTGEELPNMIKTMNSKSGMKGICGSNDMREIIKKKDSGDEKAKLAFDLFCYSVRKYIGSYFFVLDCKVDAIVFTAGLVLVLIIYLFFYCFIVNFLILKWISISTKA
eukprot:TRINITY_DN3487_c0_g1_i1.p1 TRINITY_DN3487_c0_g1~~TRINITY_DN3487_c0_g1_i1.p1  ORF type:complete len:409 (+),score=115.93 TRINITY_DN3487_c0_g1_i1:101-1228(+)